MSISRELDKKRHGSKTWKQAKCPSTEDWKKKKGVVHIYNGILAIKKEIMPFAAT